MKLLFLGSGEAFDENYPNNSHLILSETKLLLDCGFSIPFQLWKYNDNQEFLDAIYISHAHADHYFGLPALLARMQEEKRKKPLKIICQKGFEKRFKELMEFAYKSFYKTIEYEIKYIEVKDGQKIKLNELELEFASTIHAVNNLAIKISDGKNTICYSGDGMFTKKTEKLYKNTDLLIHDSYFIIQKEEGHPPIPKLIEMAERNNIKCLALTHIERFVRRKEIEKIKEFASKSKINVIIPEPMEECSF